MQWIKNVRLEVGEGKYDDGSLKTLTQLFDVAVSDRKIVEIVDAKGQVDGQDILYDAKGLLALPAFKEMHNHLDKTYLSVGWKASKPVKNLEERLAFEALELAELAETVEQRASAMIEEHIKNGVNHIRTHVNIDPYIELRNLEGVLRALDRYKDYVTADVIAFPQHGLLNGNVRQLLREALQNGATMLGALDPGGIDKDVEGSLQVTLDIASEFGVDVDMHIHDGGYLGHYTLDKWLDLVEQSNYEGKTAFSHAFALGDIGVPSQIAMAERLKKHDVAITSTIPFNHGRVIPPIDLLDKKGVAVHFGCDGFFDSWSPNGTGDVLEKANLYCDVTYKTEERAIRHALKFITNGVTPLDDEGVQQWPNVGDDASFVFVQASCSAEAIARLPKERYLMNKGKLFQQQNVK